MRYRALKTFAGQVTMRRGEERELASSLAAPLVECGYLEKVVKKKEGKRDHAGSDPEPSARSER